MARFGRRLAEDEQVLLSTRTHVKALLVPAVLLILIAGVAGFVSTFPSGKARPLLVFVIWALALLLAARVVARPFLRWMTTTYTLTNRRLISRSGVLSRQGRDIPLSRITDVHYEHGLMDRLLGCGTLVVSDAGQRSLVELHDIPQVERVHQEISDQLLGQAGIWAESGTDPRASGFDGGT